MLGRGDAEDRLGGSGLTIAPCWQRAFAEAGIQGPAAVLARAEVVRDLPDRQNLRLALGRHVVHVKRTKPRGGRGPSASAEALAGERVRALGIPVPPLIFQGGDGEGGALAGTLDLAPARPLDDCLREGALSRVDRRRVLHQLALVAAVLHGAGLHHRDFYANHVLVEPGRDEPVVAVIDWERLGVHARPFGPRVVKDLAALSASCADDLVTPGERARFLVRYLGLRGALGRRRFAFLDRRIRRKVRRIRRHVPRTPVGEAARPRGTA